MVAQKIRIYPTRTQQVLLDKNFGYARWCYNTALALWKAECKNGKNPNHRQIRDKMKADRPDWTVDFSPAILDTACEHVYSAFKNFFARRAKYPRLKSKRSAKQSFELYKKNKSSIRLRDGYWLLGKQKIKFSENPRFSVENAKRLTCSKHLDKYYISVIFEEDLPKPQDNGKYIGLDWGVQSKNGTGNYFTGDSGQTFRLTSLAEYEEKLAFRQACLSRKKKGSKQYEKAKTKLSRVQERLNNVKTDAQNKLVHTLVNSYSHIALETLSMVQLVRKNKKKHKKVHAILSYSNYEIREALKRKAVELRQIDRFEPTSRVCSSCGQLHPEMVDERIRTIVCDCGLVLDRDVNAAKNILTAAYNTN